RRSGIARFLLIAAGITARRRIRSRSGVVRARSGGRRPGRAPRRRLVPSTVDERRSIVVVAPEGEHGGDERHHGAFHGAKSSTGELATIGGGRGETEGRRKKEEGRRKTAGGLASSS